MAIPIVVSAIVVSGIGIWYLLRIRTRIRRNRLFNTPFPDTWKKVLVAHYPLYNVLPVDLQKQLQGHIQIFLDEKRFEGCGGLIMSDEIRLIVAAQACILLLNRKTNYYPNLKTILVYPKHYVDENDQVCAGESWKYGPVVLAWDFVNFGVSDMRDGHNVVYHEFAHQLDQEDGVGDGTPILESRSAIKTWADVFSTEYTRHMNDVLMNNESVLRDYGTENPAEFFAVAAEAFFEKPYKLRGKHPELYEQMKFFFRVDPAEWFQQLSGEQT